MYDQISASNGRDIKLYSWLPRQEIRLALVISHGMSEHIKRYMEFALACNQAGIVVYGANHRGHGEDADVLGHYADENGWQLVQDDLDCIIEHVKQKHSVPLILLGHSMGSFIAQNYAMQHGDKLAGLILSGSNYQAPWLYHIAKLLAGIEKKRIGASTPSLFLSWLSFGSFNRKFSPNRTRFDWLSRDEKSVDSYIKDKFCGFLCSPQLWSDLLSGLITISQPKALLSIPNNLPIYIFSGDKDPVGLQGLGVSALAKQFSAQGCEKVTTVLYPDARHETLNEINSSAVYAELLTWLESNVLLKNNAA